MAAKTKKVQVNINREIAVEAESIIDQIGLTPTTVINSLYREIIVAGRIPLNFALTPRQKAIIDFQDAIKDVPTKKVTTQKELEEFFDED